MNGRTVVVCPHGNRTERFDMVIDYLNMHIEVYCKDRVCGSYKECLDCNWTMRLNDVRVLRKAGRDPTKKGL